MLTARNGDDHAIYRELEDFYFSKDPKFAVFVSEDVKLEDRVAETACTLPRFNSIVLEVAFTLAAVVVSWFGGPVTAHHTETGELLWKYATEGVHAYDLAPSSDKRSVWVAEQPPHQEPPGQRLRLISSDGLVKREIRCVLGHSFAIVPYHDEVIRANLSVLPVDAPYNIWPPGNRP